MRLIDDDELAFLGRLLDAGTPLDPSTVLAVVAALRQERARETPERVRALEALCARQAEELGVLRGRIDGLMRALDAERRGRVR